MCLGMGVAAGISAAASAVGTAVSAFGAIQSANAQAAAYEAQAKQDQKREQIEREKGAYETARLRDRNDRAIARMRGSYLSSGIALSGSANEVIADSATEASLDEQAVLYGSQIRADDYDFSARLNRMNAGRARSAGPVNALSSIVGGVSDIAGNIATSGRQQRAFSADRTFIRNPYAYG